MDSHFISPHFNIFQSIFISPQLSHSDIMTGYKCIYNSGTQAGVQQSCLTIYGRLVTSFVLHIIAIYFLLSLVKTLTLIPCKQVTVFGPQRLLYKLYAKFFSCCFERLQIEYSHCTLINQLNNQFHRTHQRWIS